MIKAMERDHLYAVTEMVLRLWPECDPDAERSNIERIFRSESEQIFVWQNGVDVPGGFIYMALRDWAEGTNSTPVGYIEGIYVEPQYRRRIVGRSLVKAGEEWSRKKGCKEIASDAVIDNLSSQKFHRAIGFSEVSTIVCFRKSIGH